LREAISMTATDFKTGISGLRSELAAFEARFIKYLVIQAACIVVSIATVFVVALRFDR
jgi:hypothetical protein